MCSYQVMSVKVLDVYHRSPKETWTDKLLYCVLLSFKSKTKNTSSLVDNRQMETTNN